MKNLKFLFLPVMLLFLATLMINLFACTNLNDKNTSTPEPPSVLITPMNESATVIADVAPLRLFPDISSQQIGTLNRGSRITIIGISSDGKWYLVKMTGLQRDAWIAVEFITIDTSQLTITVLPTNTVLVPDTGSKISTSTNTSLPTIVMSPISTNTHDVKSTSRPTSTPTWTATLFAAHTPTPTPTGAPIDTDTPTPTLIDVPTVTPTSTGTVTSIPVATETPTLFIVNTPTNTGTGTPTPSPTESSPPTPTDTPIPADTPTPVDTPTPMDVPTPTETPI